MIDSIKINDVALDMRGNHPISFYGRLSGKTLHGIDLNFSVSDSKEVEVIENLIAQEIVQVYDPFAQQTYPASLTLQSSSYTEGRPGRHYTCQIRALDLAPEYKVLEIEGNEFPVLKSLEEVVTEQDQEGIYRAILLRLTPTQFVSLREFLERGEPLAIRRIGIDEQPLLVRCGSKMYWSKHTEGGELFYKHVVRFIHPSDFPSHKVGLAVAADQDILFRMVQALSTRFERLTDELVASGFLSSEKRTTLLNEDWRELLDRQRSKEIAWETHRIADAEEELE